MAIRNRPQVIDQIRARARFAQSALSGTPGGGLAWDHQLPRELAEQYRAARAGGTLSYTVYSYATPIAWVLADGTVVIPDARYSKTTSGHQGIAREALA